MVHRWKRIINLCVFKLEKKENNKQKRPLKLSSAGRLQLRKNLGPGKNLKSRSSEKGKTIQIIFRNNQVC